MALLAEDFDPCQHLAVHPSGHWVVKRLLLASSEREEEEDGEEKSGSFAEMILEMVSEENLRAWTTTNRGAFVTCRYV